VLVRARLSRRRAIAITRWFSAPVAKLFAAVTSPEIDWKRSSPNACEIASAGPPSAGKRTRLK